MDTVSFKFLDLEQWRIVKTIRLDKQVGSRFVWADLIYLRSVTQTYNWNSKKIQTPLGLFYDVMKEYPEDAFDKMVLKAIQKDYPDAFFKNADVFTDLEVEYFKRVYSNQYRQSALIYLIPDYSGLEYGSFHTSNWHRSFPIDLDLYVPCQDFQQFFCNEAYSLSYDRTKEEEVKSFLDDIKPTLHSLEGIISSRSYAQSVVSDGAEG